MKAASAKDFCKHWIFALSAVLAFAVLVIYSVKIWQWESYSDFDVYYRAGQRVAQGQWDSVYSLADGKSPFRYVPITLPFFRILSELSFQTARQVWFYLQFLLFGASYYVIYLALCRFLPSKEARWMSCAAFLMTVRFCLDSFTIGQVASVMLLGYSLSFLFWIEAQARFAGAAQQLPTLLKIGPGYQYLHFLLNGNWKERREALIGAALGFGGLLILSFLWFGDFHLFAQMWKGWIFIVQNDHHYIDSSHYGSQSVLSALLRLVNRGFLSQSAAIALTRDLTVLVTLGLGAFWLLRTPTSIRGRGLFFSLGVFPYLWFMPQTFKYSFHMIVIPLVMLLARIKDPVNRVALGLSFAVLSIAGKDIIGDTLFFGNQKASLPLLVSFVVAGAVFREALKESNSGKRPVRSRA